MVAVTLDITGFYFSITVDVPPNATVQDVLRAAAAQSAAGPMGQPNGQRAVFTWSESAEANGLFVKTLTVDHKVDPPARQLKPDGSPRQPCSVTAGVYTFSDDKYPKDSNIGFFWQYYVFDNIGGPNDFKIVNSFRQGPNGESIRKVIGSGDLPNKEYMFKEGSRVVWRIVGIFVRPEVPHDADGKALGMTS